MSEATLTGESFPVEKRPGVLPAQTPLARRTNCVFLGTSVRSGSATVLVDAHRARHRLRRDRRTPRRAAPETEFARGVRQFGYLLVRVMVVMVLFVITVNQLLGRPALESLLFAVALAVGLSPELLPAIVSVTLSRGAREMARARRDRAPPRGDREPRQHRRAVHRQDRHAHRGRDHAATRPSIPQAPASRGGAAARVPQRRASRPASRIRSTRRSWRRARRERLTSAGAAARSTRSLTTSSASA